MSTNVVLVISQDMVQLFSQARTEHCLFQANLAEDAARLRLRLEDAEDALPDSSRV